MGWDAKASSLSLLREHTPKSWGPAHGIILPFLLVHALFYPFNLLSIAPAVASAAVACFSEPGVGGARVSVYLSALFFPRNGGGYLPAGFGVCHAASTHFADLIQKRGGDGGEATERTER